jgi:hypothetical protein
MRIKSIFLGIAVFAMTGVFLFAQDASEPGKTSITLDFGASALSVNNDMEADSFSDAGFGEGNESTLGFSYESELYGGTASIGFGPHTYSHIDGELAEMVGDTLFSLDELSVWIKPFGPNFKFSGGIFDNKDGIGDYTDDLDNFGMGVFAVGEDGAFFGEPGGETGAGLANGFLAEAAFAPVTVQVLFGPNFHKKSNSALFTDALQELHETDARFFHMGGRVIADIGVGTVSALFKTSYWPISVWNKLMLMSEIEKAMEELGTEFDMDDFMANWEDPYGGTAANIVTFGAYADITAVENLGVSLGYTGFMPRNDASGIDNTLWSGVDLRAQYTGIEGLSLSTHNNVSFASGSEKEWTGMLVDSSFFSLYNAIGATKELTDQFSLNVEIGNIMSKISTPTADRDYDNLWGQLKFIVSPVENAEFSIGLRLETEKTTDVDTVTTFSVPVGITVSF